MIKEIKKGDSFLCVNGIVYEGLVKFIKGNVYTCKNDGELICENGIIQLVSRGDFFNDHFTADLSEKITIYSSDSPTPLATLPPYYNNEKGSLYKVATERGWNTYLFDLVKRLERNGKKDPLRQEIEKSIGVLQLWLKELKE